MLESDGRKIHAPPSGTDRRAHERYPVHLNVTLRSATSPRLACVASDVSIGGLLLNWAMGAEDAGVPDITRLDVDDAVDITCTVRQSGASRTLSFEGRVVRRANGGVAIRFVNPDLGALQVLLGHARAQGAAPQSTPVPSGARKASSQTTVNGSTARDLLSVCDRTVEGMLRSLMTRFNEMIMTSLFEAAKQISNIAEQNSFFGALKIINNTKESMTASFLRTVRSDLETRSPYSPPPGSAGRAGSEL